MEDLVNLIATNSSPSSVSDKIKEILYTKTADRIDLLRPQVSSTLFGDEE